MACVWNQEACTWSVGSARRDGKPRTTHHARILNADLDVTASFDYARIARGVQVDARTRREVCRKTLPRWCRTTDLAPT
jgi:hypothetical protein